MELNATSPILAQESVNSQHSELTAPTQVEHAPLPGAPANELQSSDIKLTSGQQPGDSEGAQSTPEAMQETADKLSEMMSMLRKGLSFQVDSTLGTPVISVLDIDTGTLIRQIPNEEALELAIKLHEKMAEMDGLLMSTTV